MKVHKEIPFDIENAIVFYQPNRVIKSYLKSLFIKVKVEGKVIRGVLVDGGPAINLSFSDLLPHNMVITVFNGKRSTSLEGGLSGQKHYVCGCSLISQI